jgi:hypothetical protein
MFTDFLPMMPSAGPGAGTEPRHRDIVVVSLPPDPVLLGDVASEIQRIPAPMRHDTVPFRHAVARAVAVRRLLIQEANRRGLVASGESRDPVRAPVPNRVHGAGDLEAEDQERWGVADDRRVFAATRPSFLRAWISMPQSSALACVEAGRLVGWGVIFRESSSRALISS